MTDEAGVDHMDIPTIESEIGTEVHVFVTDDKMHVVLECNPCVTEPDSVVSLLSEQITSLGIFGHPAYEKLLTQLKWCADHDRQTVKMRVVSGVAPTPPKHGEIVWGGDYFKEGFYENPDTGAMDYRRPLAQRNVAEGELLARILPPVEGAEGMDVFGAALLPEPAVPVKLEAGTNVVKSETGDTLTARTAGRIRLADRVLHVDEIYHIEGSIGLATGNITHPGALDVHGDIEAGAIVKANGDVVVTGIVEDAEIECTGSITVAGGIVGDTHARIKCGGSLNAKFLRNAHVDVEGNVEAQNSIDNCVIRCRGAVHVQKGRVVGGEVTALGGIVVQQAGSAAAVPTILIAGEDYSLIDRLREEDKAVQSYSEGIARLNEAIEPMRCKEKILSSNQRQALTLLLNKLTEFEEKRDALNRSIEAMLSESHDRAHHQIVVLGKAFPDTLFRVHGMITKCLSEETGPFRVILHEGDVAFLPYKAAPGKTGIHS